MIYATPSATGIEASLSGANTGLVGTIGYQIIDGQGGITTTRTTTGIVESPAGSGVYTATFTAPAAAGRYSLVWDTGGSNPVYAPEDLTVTTTTTINVISGTSLVTLTDARAYLNIADSDTSHDTKLQMCIDAATPLIENITGPIVTATFDEWHTGGQYFVQARRRPSTTYGTSPVFTLTSASEFLGSTEHPLTIITDPAHGTLYSVMADSKGTITRRGPGGAVMAFAAGPQAVHIAYQAGQASVPANVFNAALELIRVNYQTTQAAGRGRLTIADDEDQGMPPMGFFMPRRVREMLTPNRRAPSVA